VVWFQKEFLDGDEFSFEWTIDWGLSWVTTSDMLTGGVSFTGKGKSISVSPE
jgi:hypothetical protein